MDPFEEKLMGHYGPLFKYAWSITRNYHDAEDLLHEVMCEALKYRADFASHESMGAALRSNMRHRFYDMLRKKYVRIRVLHKIKTSDQHIEANQTAAAELSQVLFAIGMLPEANARTLRAIAIEGRHPNQVATDEKIGIPAVYRRLENARRMLREIFDE